MFTVDLNLFFDDLLHLLVQYDACLLHRVLIVIQYFFQKSRMTDFAPKHNSGDVMIASLFD